MKKSTLLVLFCLQAFFSYSQQKTAGSIKGTVVDVQNRLPLPDATITVLNRADSAVAGFSVAGKAGDFEIKNIPAGQFIFTISFTGYSPYVREIEITPSLSVLNLDTIALATDTTMLAGIVITAPPIRVKQDTVEFSASAFKTLPNATAEDLLKKLPGVEVDKDGNITAQGEPITKIYVDGKEFFGNDPKLATKNLTAELIESIQVFDDMSEQAKFTRIDDGSRTRTINIKLKKDRKQGIFGRVNAGLGSRERYEGTASLNMFRDRTQLSILGGANNTNRQGYTFNDLISSMGGMSGINGNRGGQGPSGSAGNGNTNSWSTGINFRDQWGKKIEFAGNYFVSRSSNVNNSKSFRQNFLTEDSVSFADEISYRKNVNLNHRIGMRIEYFIDSMNSIVMTPNINIQRSESESFDSLITRATSPKFDYTAITSTQNRNNQRDGLSLNNNLLFRHRFHKPGRTFTIGWNTALNESDGEGYNITPYLFYNPDGSLKSINDRRQRNDLVSKSFNNTISASITEMVDSDKILELNYAYTNNKSINDRDVFDYDPLTGEYDSVNRPQTNYFENVFEASRLGTNFRVKKQKYDYQLGGSVQFASLYNLSNRATTGKDSTMRQTYTNFFPNASFNYNLGARKTLRFNYRGSTRAPSISQLQDVLDVSNPLRNRIGNPDLKQEFNNNVRLSYNGMNPRNFLFVNANISATIIGNKIVNSIDSLSEAVLLVKPENVDGAFNINISGTIGIPLKKVTTGRRSPLNLNLTTRFGYNRDVSMLYKKINYNHSRRIGERINFNYNIQNKLDLNATASFNYNDARYSVQENLNYKYFDQHYSVDFTYTFFKNFMLNNDFDYYINTGRADGFNQAIPLWNASFSWLFFKKRNGELKFRVIDLLGQNKNIDRTVGENYLEDTYTEVLQRYFMVSFMYNFNKFGGGSMPSSRGNGGRRFNN
jgi:hypothetical protein